MMVRITEELLRKSAEHNEGLISSLEEVALHQRDIEKIENIGNWCRDLKILDLTSNLIPKIENLHKLKKLEYLKLGLNNIERIENLEGCESLKKLDLTVNFIGELTSIESLQGLEHLQEMYLMGNPCTEFDGYREFVTATLPKLKFLDGHEIMKSERLRAMQEIHEIRSGIIQQQKKYFLRRQKEKEEAGSQEVTGDEEIPEVKKTPEDEEAEEKSFWEEKVSYTPESRLRVHEHQQKAKEKQESSGKPSKKEKKERKLEADDGRILNINEAKFDFTLTEDDDQQALILDIAVYKYMDTSMIDIDINPTYVRGFIRGKIFQLVLPEEVQPMSSKAQRVTTNGHLVLTMPKVKQIIKPANVPERRPLKDSRPSNENSSTGSRTEKLEVDPNAHQMVDFTNIVKENEKSVRAPLGSNQPWWARKLEEKSPSADFVDDPEVPPLINGQPFSRLWWLYDAKWQSPFQSARLIQRYLEGKHKPIYHPLSDVGDHVVVINTREIAMEGDLWRTFKHFHHTGYPGGFSETRAYKVHDKDPRRILEKTIYSCIKGTLLRRPMMQKLHLYPDENVPEDILKNITGQIRQVMPVLKRLDEYTKEERENFPRLFDWPKDYIIKTGNKNIKS